MTFYLRTLTPDSPYVAIPVFPNRVFRHSCIYVNTDSGIEHPSDLVGKRIGEFGMYSQDSGIWAKGILMDEHGFRPQDNTWVIGGLDARERAKIDSPDLNKPPCTGWRWRSSSRRCIFMHLLDSSDDPDAWVMVEQYRSRAAWDAHMASDHNRHRNQILEPLLARPNDLRLYQEK